MNFANRLVARTLCVVGITAAGGCNNVVGTMLNTPGQDVTGLWLGRLVEVAVRDQGGWTYHAAALQIESGPRLPYRVEGGDEAWATDRTIVLTDKEHLTINVKSLPANRRVRVSGTLRPTTLHGRRSDGTTHVVTSEPTFDDNTNAELSIRISNPPKILDDGK